MLSGCTAVLIALLQTQAAVPPPDPWWKTWGGIAALCVALLTISGAILAINRLLTLSLLESAGGQARLQTLLNSPPGQAAIITALSTPACDAVISAKINLVLTTPNARHQILGAVEEAAGKARLLLLIKQFLDADPDVQRQIRDLFNSPAGEKVLLAVITSPEVFDRVMKHIEFNLFLKSDTAAGLVDLGNSRLAQLAREGKVDEIYSATGATKKGDADV